MADEVDEADEARHFELGMDRDRRDRPMGSMYSSGAGGPIEVQSESRDPRDSRVYLGNDSPHAVLRAAPGPNDYYNEDDEEEYEEVAVHELQERSDGLSASSASLQGSKSVLGNYDPEDEGVVHVDDAPVVAVGASSGALPDPLSPHKDSSVELGDGSDPNAVHCWGKLQRRYRTGIIMAMTFVVLLLLIGAILLPSNQGSGAASTRRYYIAADKLRWDYLPSSADLLYGPGADVPPAGRAYTQAGERRLGSSYIKAQYRAYTNHEFAEELPASGESAVRGIVGPTIYCQVGDTISVLFKNNLEYTTSLHVHGLRYKKPSEGWWYGGDPQQRPEHVPSPPVPPGETREYLWEADENSGPEANDGLSVAWLYYPGQDVEADWNAGLIGMVVVTRFDGAANDGTPSQAADNLPLLFATFDENLSPFLQQTAEENLGAHWDPQLLADPDFRESNRMASINGYVFCNLPVIDLQAGQYVQWYLATMSNGHADEWYVALYHGNTVVVDSHRIDAVALVPGEVLVAEMRPANRGKWLIRAATTALFNRGVTALYSVQK